MVMLPARVKVLSTVRYRATSPTAVMSTAAPPDVVATVKVSDVRPVARTK